MKIKSIDRQACDLLRDAINENCAEIAKELGVKITCKSGSFDSGQVTFKVECAVLNENGEAQTKEASDFKFYAARYGLKPEDLGREFTDFNGKRWYTNEKDWD